MERALAYIRVSSDRQLDGNSLITQERRVREYAESKGYELVRVFVEEGETAKTDNRTVLQEMLGFARQNRRQLQVLIFPKVDRFARYTEDYFHLKRTLRELGMRVESADERFDDSPAGRFMESLLAATAQFDNDVRAERCKAGMREAVLQGRWVWSAPYGYRNVRVGNRSNIEPDPVAGPLIRRAFELLAAGRRFLDVRRWLADHDIRISRSRLYKLFASRAYIGIIDAFGVSQPASPPFLPLISEATFLKARAAIRTKRYPSRHERDRADFPLRGTVRCRCGSFLTASWSRGRSRLYPYYRCRHCSGVNLASPRVEQRWLRSLKDVANRFVLTEESQADLVSLWRAETSVRSRRIGELSQEIKNLTELQASLAMKNAQGVLPDHVARKQLDELDEKLLEKRGHLEELRLSNGRVDEVLSFCQAFLTEIRERWLQGDLPTKKHIQRFFFPEGGTVILDWPCRTAETPLPSGVTTTPTSKVSCLVGHDDKLTNQFRGRNKPKSRKERLELLKLMYREFGPDSQTSSPAPADSKRR